MTFISLLIVCSASWLIKIDGNKIFDKTDVSSNYKEKVADDTLGDWFTIEVTYNGAYQEPKITDVGAQALYGMTAAEAEAANKYDAIWQYGEYTTTYINNGVISKESTTHQGVYAGTHYYRIIDNDTKSVICYKHLFKIDQREVTLKKTESILEFQEYNPKFTIPILGVEVDENGAEKPLAYTEEMEFGALSYEATGGTAGQNVPVVSNTRSFPVTKNDVLAKLSDEYKNNYKVSSDFNYSVTHYVLPQTYITDSPTSTTATYYGSLMDAIAVAYNNNTTGDNIYAMQSFTYAAISEANIAAGSKTVTAGVAGDYSHEITANCTINSGDTLWIPYSATYTPTYDSENNNRLIPEFTNSTGYPSVRENIKDSSGKTIKDVSQYYANGVIIHDAVILTNAGTIVIPGVVTGGAGGHQASMTSGAHSRIKMSPNSTILNTGNMYCFGFIDECVGYIQTTQEPTEKPTKTNGAQVYNKSGYMEIIFSIIEHRGGSAFSGMLESALSDRTIKEATPFNRFFTETIATDLIVDSGAFVTGICDFVVTNPLNQQLKHIKNFVGFFSQDSKAFIKMESGTRVTLRYDTSLQKNFMKINGSVSVNPLSVSMEAPLVGTINLSTQYVFLPLSHYWNITFDKFVSGADAIVTATNQDIKILPGAVVIVNSGVTLNARNLVIYSSSYKDDATVPSVPSAGGFNYYLKGYEDSLDTTKNTVTEDEIKNVADGRLIVNGNLNATRLGGYVETSGTTGKITINTSNIVETLADNSLRLKEISFTSGDTVEYVKRSFTANGLVAVMGTPTDKTILNTNIDYTSYQYGTKDNEETGEPESLHAWQYDNEIITITYNTNGGTAVSQTTVSGKSSEGKALVLTNQITTRAYYTFGGWCYENGENAQNGDIVNQNITLYAKWIPHSGTATFYNVTPDGISIRKEIDFDADDKITLEQPTTEGDYNFNGWYKDETCETKHTSSTISGEELMANGKVLYAQWIGEKTYQIEYVSKVNGKDHHIDDFANFNNDVSDSMRSNTIQVLEGDDTYVNNNSEKYYFVGWKCTYVNANGETVTANVSTFEFIPDNANSGTKYTLEALWEEKPYTLNVSGTLADGTYNDPISLDNGTFYFTQAQLDSGITLSELLASFETVAKGGNSPIDTNIKVNKYFAGWSKDGGTSVITSISTGDFTTNSSETNKYTLSLMAKWGNKYSVKCTSLSNASLSFTADKSQNGGEFPGDDIDTTFWYLPGTTLKFTVSYDGMFSRSFKITKSDGTTSTSTSLALSCDISVLASSETTCIVEGTLITLADGTQKKIEDLVVGDMLLVFNHETGKLDVAPLIMLDHAELDAQWYRVMNLVFSDNEILRIYNSHGIFDVTLNKYVFITEENMLDYIGHEFYTTYYNGEEFVSEIVTLTEAYITEEYVKVYGPLTAWYMSCFANDILTFAPAPHDITTGHTNIFELDENMKYDEEKMQADIEKYGLFTYEELSEYLTVEQFNALPFKYFKISIGKGLMTWDEMIYCIEYIIANS